MFLIKSTFMRISSGMAEWRTRSASSTILPGWNNTSTVDPPNLKKPCSEPFSRGVAWGAVMLMDPTIVAPTATHTTRPNSCGTSARVSAHAHTQR